MLAVAKTINYLFYREEVDGRVRRYGIIFCKSRENGDSNHLVKRLKKHFEAVAVLVFSRLDKN